MAGTVPIRLGDANTSSLIPKSNSTIRTDDFGIQRGSISYSLGDQTVSQASRISIGTSYFGMLTQFSGFYVQSSGDITGQDGQTSSIDISYARIDPLAIIEPVLTTDIELKQIQIGNLPTVLGFLETLYTVVIAIPHPVIKFRFGSSSRPNQIGTYGTPSGAPSVGVYNVKVDQSRIQSAFMTQQDQIIPGGIFIEIFPAGTCSETLLTKPIIGGTFSANAPSPSDALNLSFRPDSNGWFCQTENSTSICNGRIFAIEQSWINRYTFSSLSGGSVWQGTCIL